jgi:hypothetical protein
VSLFFPRLNPQSKAKPLRESDSDNKAKEDDAASDSDTPAAPLKEVAVPEKKKKRKLFGAQPAFQWDPIMSVSRAELHAVCGNTRGEMTAMGDNK